MDSLVEIKRLEVIDDCNDSQEFRISEETSPREFCRYMKLVFGSSTDFYGRVTIYNMEIYGEYEQ